MIRFHGLICHNEQGRVNRLTRDHNTSIINLTFTTSGLAVQDSSIIDEEKANSFDNKMLVFDLANLDERTIGIRMS